LGRAARTVRALDHDQLPASFGEVHPGHTLAVKAARLALGHDDGRVGLAGNGRAGGFHGFWERLCGTNWLRSTLAATKVAHDVLLRFDRLAAIDHQELEVRAHGQVLLQNPALKNAEALVRVAGKPQTIPASKYFSCGRPSRMRCKEISSGALKKNTRSGMAAKL